MIAGSGNSRSFGVRPLLGLPEIEDTPEGLDLGELIVRSGSPTSEDIIVCSQKIVSKAEGRIRRLSEVEPGKQAINVAREVDRDPRLVELILGESQRIIRATPGRLIVETRSGWICANAGIDSSNVPDPDCVCLLPEDADASARRIRDEIEQASGQRPAVLIADSFGRAWRLGQAEAAIGCAGLNPIRDWSGRSDANGETLSSTSIAVADHLAAVADLVRDKDSQVPGAVISGLGDLVTSENGAGATSIQRPEAEDLFR